MNEFEPISDNNLSHFENQTLRFMYRAPNGGVKAYPFVQTTYPSDVEMESVISMFPPEIDASPTALYTGIYLPEITSIDVLDRVMKLEKPRQWDELYEDDIYASLQARDEFARQAMPLIALTTFRSKQTGQTFYSIFCPNGLSPSSAFNYLRGEVSDYLERSLPVGGLAVITFRNSLESLLTNTKNMSDKAIRDKQFSAILDFLPEEQIANTYYLQAPKETGKMDINITGCFAIFTEDTGNGIVYKTFLHSEEENGTVLFLKKIMDTTLPDYLLADHDDVLLQKESFKLQTIAGQPIIAIITGINESTQENVSFISAACGYSPKTALKLLKEEVLVERGKLQ